MSEINETNKKPKHITSLPFTLSLNFWYFDKCLPTDKLIPKSAPLKVQMIE
jgi:hypothetical protein